MRRSAVLHSVVALAALLLAQASVMAQSDMVKTMLRFPGGTGADGHVVMEKLLPREVQVGEQFDYSIIITNRTGATVHDVVVSDQLDNNLNVISAEPSPTKKDGMSVWNLGTMKPNDTATIKLKVSAKGEGDIVNCGSVTYVPTLCIATRVVKPALTLTKAATPEVLQCDPITLEYNVCNTGSGAATNVVIEDKLPAGVKTQDGKDVVSIAVGTLPPGQCAKRSVVVIADRKGNLGSEAVATAAGNLRAAASAATKVIKPQLTIAKTGPAMRYVGRPIDYQIVVTNTGDGVARNATLEDTLPTNARLVTATGGGQLGGGKIAWRLGDLNPGESRTLEVKLMGNEIGVVKNSARAVAYCAESVDAVAQTEVKGIPAVLLEVIDVDDPVELGNNTTYVITVTNQGSTTGTNIKIDCTLEDSMEYVSATGATQASAAGKTISFAPLPALGAGAKASWQVVVKAVKTGDVRFGVKMNTDQLDRPVSETESTNFYDGR